MDYRQFHESVNYKITGARLSPGVLHRGYLIQESSDGAIYVDRERVTASSVDNARDVIDQQAIVRDIRRQLREQEYHNNLINTVAEAVSTHKPGVRVTDTLVEQYIDIAASKRFSIDPIVLEIRQKNLFDTVIEGYIDFSLDDGSTVVVSDQMCATLNNMFAGHRDVIAYMTESKDNFLDVVNLLRD